MRYRLPISMTIMAIMAVLLMQPISDHGAAHAQASQQCADFSTFNVRVCLAPMSVTATPTATATMVMATSTSIPQTSTSVAPTATTGPVAGQPCPTSLHPSTGWHPPVHAASGCFYQHEHGDAPPSWITSAFTQNRESHVGYKGVLKSMSNGVESYIITHVLSTISARSHGDHDYALWVKDPSGGISFWQGQMDFGSPPPLRTTDTGERPIILSVGDGGCETWYSRPGNLVFDIGWTICGRYQNFAGVTVGGNGAYRGTDWTIMKDRLASFSGAAPTLAQYAQLQFGVERFQFIDTGHLFPDTGVVPIN